MGKNKTIKNLVSGSVDDNKTILIRLIVGLIFLSEGIQEINNGTF